MLKTPFSTPEHSVFFTHDFTDYLLDQTPHVLYVLFIDPVFYWKCYTLYSPHQTSHCTILYTSEHLYAWLNTWFYSHTPMSSAYVQYFTPSSNTHQWYKSFYSILLFLQNSLFIVNYIFIEKTTNPGILLCLKFGEKKHQTKTCVIS